MELYEVTFKGKKVTLKKDSKGNYSIDLPSIPVDKDGSIKETITHDRFGWKFNSIVSNKPELYFNLWLTDEGKFFWENAAKKETRPFDPSKEKVGRVNAIASELEKTVAQIKVIDAKGIPATEILKKRMFNLVTAINLLGYENFEEALGEASDSPGFMALNRLAEQLNEQMNRENLARYITSGGFEGEELVVRVTIPQDMTREEFDAIYKPMEKEFDSNMLFKKDQEKWIDEKRGYAFDYKALMSMKLLDTSLDGKGEDWQCYEKAVENMARLYIELNSDLLTPELKEKFRIPDIRRIKSKIECADAISNVIDTGNFNRALRIENLFAYAEAERMKGIIETKLEGTEPSEDESDRTKKAREILKQEIAEMQIRQAAIDREKIRRVTDKELDEKE